MNNPISVETYRYDQALPQAQSPISVMIWNIGYAGLGENSDFRADGGERIRAADKEKVKENLAGIKKVLNAHPADVLMMQELAADGFLTRGVNVWREVRETLGERHAFFSMDIKTRLLPRFVSLQHGLGVFSRVSASSPDIIRLPDEPNPIMGFIHRRYHVQRMEVDANDGLWTFINVHLSAFDEGAETRHEQLRAVLDIAEAEHAKGRLVVVGGDWNMRLTETNFPNTTEPKHLFWIYDFPHDQLPSDWRLAFDPSTPSVRTNERPYKRGENYTTIIDGLLVSPNVDVKSAETIDLDFKYTDHQPIRFELSPKSDNF